MRSLIEVALMEGYYSIQRLLALRKLTRSIADSLKKEATAYVATLAPQLRPRAILGDYVQSSVKGEVKGAELAFQELQKVFETTAGSSLYALPKKLSPPVEIASTAVMLNQLEYGYDAKASSDRKRVAVTAPLQWVLSYAGFPPSRLAEMLRNRQRDAAELQNFVLHYLMIHIVTTRQPGLLQMLEALRYPIVTRRLPEYGDLPLTCIHCALSTVLPPDDVIIESTEISGRDVFEEIIKPEEIPALRDNYKERLIELVKNHGEYLLGGD
jgi:hypothetical protein